MMTDVALAADPSAWGRLRDWRVTRTCLLVYTAWPHVYHSLQTRVRVEWLVRRVYGSRVVGRGRFRGGGSLWFAEDFFLVVREEAEVRIHVRIHCIMIWLGINAVIPGYGAACRREHRRAGSCVSLCGAGRRL
jgi:hypothetical protein